MESILTKVLIAESLDIDTLNRFEETEGVYIHTDSPMPSNKYGSDIHFLYRPDFTEEDIKKEIIDYDGLIVRPREVSASLMNYAKKLKIIVRGGSGINAIDVDAAKKLNIIVENTPGQNSVSTAEYTFALIMELLAKRNINISYHDVKNNTCKDPKYYQGQELSKKKIAIIGMGNIGQLLAKMCAGFDMDISYYNRSKKDLPYRSYDSVEELLVAKPDVVSLNIPLTPETNGFFGEKEFSLMKKESLFINTARPQLVDSVAFGKALVSGFISSAAIDGDMDLIEPFLKVDKENKCIFTNHIADSTKQAQEKITQAALSQIIEYFRNGKLINAV
jgi:D-3-phosphoglycerate dehydrogenase